MYVAGNTNGTLPTQAQIGQTDAFVTKIDLAGTTAWTRQFGTTEFDTGKGVGVGGGGVYVGGTTKGVLQYQNRGRLDAFVRRYDGDGNVDWTRQFGTLDDDLIEDMAVTPGGVYAGGWTLGSLQGYSDVFARRYDAAGTDVWTEQTGTDGYDVAEAVAASPAGVFVGGHTGGGFSAPNAGGYDAFVHRIVGYRPDASLSTSSSSGYVGNDVYNRSGSGQTQSVTVARGGKRTFYVRAQNDGDAADTIKVGGCEGGRNFSVRYLSGASGSSSITSAVVAGTSVLNVAPGQTKTIRLVVEVAEGATVGDVKTCLVTLGSAADPTSTDVVRARVQAGS